MNSDVTVLGAQISLLWIVIGAALVVFMQAGFALVETGLCRAKHAAHVASTNFAVFGLGFVGFFLIGFPLAFGGFSYSAFGLDAPVGEALIGSGNWVFAWGGGWALSGGNITPALLGFFLYMAAFMDTTATIPTGSMAERWKWGSFVIWGLFCGGIYYPLIAAWTWGGGWLAKTWATMSLGAGYVDFAGSGVVHMVGGVAALTGAMVLGPRIGKYDKKGNAITIAGHYIPMAML
jgi:Amt family ammonium transporter